MDNDQTASSGASCSGSSQFSKVDISGFSSKRVNSLLSSKPYFLHNRQASIFYPMETGSIIFNHIYYKQSEWSGSVLECLTRDREAAGSSLTGVTVLWSFSKTHLS